MEYKCLTQNIDMTRKLFLALPDMIYHKINPQDKKLEMQILCGQHPISNEIETNLFVVVDNFNKPVCRCLMTYYKDDPTAYVGFFESKESVEAVKLMFQKVELRASRDGKTSLLGPIDASVYIKYRFKVDHFDSIYTGEPYNKDYYHSLWQQVGFSICQTYVSNQMRQIRDEDYDPKIEKIYQTYVDNGYYFCNPNKGNFDRSLDDIYELLMQRLDGFAGYNAISKQQFRAIYADIKKIANYDMIHLVYQDERLKAFSVSLPNYYGLTNSAIGVGKLLEIMKIKKAPKEYVILCIDADSKSPGLAAALLHAVQNTIYMNKCTSICALIREGDVLDRLYEQMQTDRYEYVLLSKEVRANDIQ
jgi:hypothetical protein